MLCIDMLTGTRSCFRLRFAQAAAGTQWQLPSCELLCIGSAIASQLKAKPRFALLEAKTWPSRARKQATRRSAEQLVACRATESADEAC